MIFRNDCRSAGDGLDCEVGGRMAKKTNHSPSGQLKLLMDSNSYQGRSSSDPFSNVVKLKPRTSVSSPTKITAVDRLIKKARRLAW